MSDRCLRPLLLAQDSESRFLFLNHICLSCVFFISSFLLWLAVGSQVSKSLCVAHNTEDAVSTNNQNMLHRPTAKPMRVEKGEVFSPGTTMVSREEEETVGKGREQHENLL